jgi:hypothetical protein
MATGEEIPVRKVIPTTPAVAAQPQALPVRKVIPTTPGQIPVRKVTSIKPVSSPVPDTPKESRTADDVKADPAAMKQIRDYMTSRKGEHVSEMDDADLYDTFVNHMRWFGSNEIGTVGELRWLYGQEEAGKALAGGAYQVFDSLGNVFVNDGLTGAIDGVVDYTANVVMSPSSWLGAGVGKLVVGSASKAAATTATKVAIEAAKRAAIKAALAEGAKKGLKGAALKEAAKVAGVKAADKVATQASRKIALKQAGVATVADGAMSVGADAAYQETQMEAGVQEEYSAAQGALAAAGGIIGGAISYFPQAMRGTSGLADVSGRMRAGAAKQRAVAAKKLGPAARVMGTKFIAKMAPWADAVSKGADLTDSIKFSDDIITHLLKPGPAGEAPLLQEMLTTAGVQIKKGAKDPAVMEQVVEYTRRLAPADKKALNDQFQPLLGVSFDEMVDIMASTLSKGGTDLGFASRFGENVNKMVRANKLAEADLKRQAELEAKLKDNPKIIEYVQSIWRRALVSHPATTAVNVKGWSITNMFGTAAELAYAAATGTFGAALSVVPGSAAKGASKEALRRSQALFANQVFKARTLLDPYTTREAAEELFATLPKSYSKLIGESTFGLDSRGAASYGLNPDSLLTKTSERYVSNTAKISGLNLQDAFTKSYSVLWELDRLTRLKYNKGWSEMLEAGEAHLISDDVLKKSIERGLKDTFSMDYTRGFGHLSRYAGLIENLSSTPGLGFIFPFGRFMNNAMAFTLQYSPFAVMPLANQMIKKGVFSKKALSNLASDEAQMTLAKATVGTLAVAWLAMGQTEKEKQGLAWNQDMDNTGQVLNDDNLAPLAAYQVMGRIGSLWARGEKATGDELLRDAGTQLILGQLFRDVGIGSGVSEMAGYMLSLADDEAGQENFGKTLTTVIGFIGGEVVSGFMRPLEPLNLAGQIFTDNDMSIDRRQLKGSEKAVANTFRYVDFLFVPFLEPDEKGRNNFGVPLQSLTKEGPQREPNPLARLTGRREEAPLTNADRMLNMVNLPAWTQSERTGLPEWDALVHKKITRILETRATALLESPAWKQSSQRERGLKVKALLKIVKQQARNMVVDSNFEGRMRDEQRKWLSKDDDLRILAKKKFDLQGTPDAELTIPQISMMQNWIKHQEDVNKAIQ